MQKMLAVEATRGDGIELSLEMSGKVVLDIPGAIGREGWGKWEGKGVYFMIPGAIERGGGETSGRAKGMGVLDAGRWWAMGSGGRDGEWRNDKGKWLTPHQIHQIPPDPPPDPCRSA